MKRKLSILRTQLSGIIIICFLLAVIWACRKERSLEIEPDLSEEVTALSDWYKRQLIPTDNPESFAKMNQPLWSGTKMINKGDTLFFTTLLFSKEKITRELHVRYYDGVYNGVVRQYDFGFTDSLSAGTFTLNGRLIDMGYFDATNTYTLTVLAGNRNLILMGTETINGGTLPEANVPAPPSNPFPPIWIPPTSPVGPPPGPSYPPPGWGSGGGGGNPNSNATSVLIVIEGEKIDPKEETKCFDLSKPAILTIYIQQPNENTRDKMGANSVGHAFIGIQQGNITRYLGFYPNSPNASLISSQQSEIHDNSGTLYHINISLNVGANNLGSVINYINNYPKTYDLNNYNCGDFVINVAEKGGLNLPKTTGSYDAVFIKFKGRNPGDLGQDIRNMPLPSGVTRSTTKGNVPKKKGGC